MMETGKVESEEVVIQGHKRHLIVRKPIDDAGKETGVELRSSTDGFLQHIKLTKPFVMQSGQEVQVTYAYERTKRKSDTLTIITQYPTKVFIVKAFLCDAGVADLELQADAAHRLGPAKVNLDVQGSRYVEWRFPTAVLPGQGFELHWFPKQPKMPEKKD